MTWARHGHVDDGHGRLAEAKAAEQQVREEENDRAARTVAMHAHDVTECAELLDMLGLRAPARTV